MATETTYNVIKVQELREISSAAGNDEIIINDVDSTPLETKKINVENFAYAIKDYVLPIASAEILGGIRVGQGLSINPTNGVLRNDIYYINDLHDVQVVSPKFNQVLTYDGAKWANKEFQGITEIIAGDGLSGGGDNGSVIINVNPGDGISIENDRLNVNTGLGLKTSLDVVLVDNHTSLTFVGNQLAVNPGTAIILDEFGTSVNYGRGLTLFGPELEPDLGRGLQFEANEIAVRAGFGLGFDGSDLVLRANIEDLMNVVVDNPINGDILIWDGTNWVNDNLSCASTTESGLVRLSTDDEVCSAVNGVNVIDPPEGLCHKVVGLNNVEGLTRCILNLLNFLGDEFANLYCNEDVIRDDINEPATYVPPIVVNEYEKNKHTHGDEPVEKLAFRSLPQAMNWLASRSPVSIDHQTIWICGTAYHPDDGLVAQGKLMTAYNAPKPIKIRGINPSTEARDRNVAYLGENYIYIDRGYNYIEVRDCTLNMAGTPSDPNRPSSFNTWGTLLYVASGCILRNCTLKVYSGGIQAVALHYRYQSGRGDEAYFDFYWDQPYPTTIEIDGKTFAEDQPYVGTADLYMGKTRFICMHGSNTAQNYFIHRMRNVHPNGHKSHQCYVNGDFSLLVYGRGYPRDVKGYGNWLLDWIYDFEGTAANTFFGFRVEGNIENYIAANNTVTRGRLRSVVQSKGALDKVYVFKTIYNKSLNNVSDIRAGFPTSCADIIGDAFRQKGLPSSRVYNHYVPCFTVYNQQLVSVGCATIGNNLGNARIEGGEDRAFDGPILVDAQAGLWAFRNDGDDEEDIEARIPYDPLLSGEIEIPDDEDD